MDCWFCGGKIDDDEMQTKQYQVYTHPANQELTINIHSERYKNCVFLLKAQYPQISLVAEK